MGFWDCICSILWAVENVRADCQELGNHSLKDVEKVIICDTEKHQVKIIRGKLFYFEKDEEQLPYTVTSFEQKKPVASVQWVSKHKLPWLQLNSYQMLITNNS